ncbi:acetyl/propionyl/methylcrotonyl-CoA carboxylase subunit alpha [Parvularcula oceani]|uniref:acetyl/propionyl/methylcrotonyl-CoA carboxylase subunit alpha n=1 Tax=Parvularcula oceani TaxID=1247963 RepID=UPI0004E22ECC|nr:acetyl-CoA carboxylase biotin carboxylase subunit [Parvularcula oceani]
MISKLLIANRGEIALRVLKTARRLGIRTVAVFSEADRNAPHVRQADEAFLTGPAPAAESYLRGDAILDVAERAGADAIHPGYGFLSENAGFARACEKRGITFVGPTAETIEVMGSKSRAKDLMEKAGVPLAPGYQGEEQSAEVFEREARRIGYPVLLKAAAGGGGKGMRIVREERALRGELESAQREAKSAFGDDRFLVEKFLKTPRHVEVQVFGDGRGNIVHLFERDCSVQRRYQKVIEEAPAPDLPANVRTRLLEAGVEAARAVSYRGAGTVEFLYDGKDSVYFMEMNTRLQVEHPVTEGVTGIDLVEWQLRIASGEDLPLTQDEIACEGHSVEARLYAEDPAKGYMPSTGRLDTLRLPRGRGIRIDAGVAEGDTVTPFYDPMIAKVIAKAETREAALARLADALARTRVRGVTTNADFLRRIVTHEDFVAGAVSTAFLDEAGEAVTRGRAPEPPVLALAAIWRTAQAGGGFRLNLPAAAHARFEGPDGPLAVTMDEVAAGRWEGAVGGEALTLEAVETDGKGASALIGGRRLALRFDEAPGGLAFGSGRDARGELAYHDPLTAAGDGGADAAGLLSPMPATVTGVLVDVGAEVEADTPLLTIEAMKMEHVVKAPGAGTVRELPFAEGDSVAEGVLLVGFDAAE